MAELVIRGATIVDGTGGPRRDGDVAVDDGRISAVGDVPERGETEVDADGLVLAPGFVDIHTHYDAQFFWDGMATPSSLHGVTSVFNGNCGFTLAPVDDGGADYLRPMMSQVEGMSLQALTDGVPWDWRSFPEYLDRLEGALGVNAGFLVGHCALRRTVMGDAAVGTEADASTVARMGQVLGEALAAGGMGFSTTRSFTHTDGDGHPVPSRAAGVDEVLALCEVAGQHPGTTLEIAMSGCLRGFEEAEIELLVAMSRTAGRPVNWNVLTVDHEDPETHEWQLEPSRRAAAQGGRVVALTMPTLVGMNMSLLTHCGLHLLPDWDQVMRLPAPERMARLRDGATRRWLQDRAASDEAGVFRRLTNWGQYRIGDTFSSANAPLEGRIVSDIARERGQEPFDALVDICLADDLRTVLWPLPPDDVPEAWEMRRDLWASEHTVLGGSDAGAHLDRMMGANYPTVFLGDCLRGRRLVELEEAVRMLTSDQADLYGLVDRGRVRAGHHADLVLFDPDTVGSGPARMVDDLPAGSRRLFADAHGIAHVFVGGTETVRDGHPTGARPGRVLRSGRDTRTVVVGG